MGLFGAHKRVYGKIIDARKGLGDIRLQIDVGSSVIKKVFSGDIEPRLLNGKNVSIYFHKINNKKAEHKEQKKAA